MRRLIAPKVALGVALLVAVGATRAEALLLGQLDPGPISGATSSGGDGLTVYLALSDDLHSPDSNPNAELFESLFLTPADAGRTFIANASNESDFADAVAVLVNGSNDFIRVAVEVTDSQDPGSRLGGNDRTYDESFWFPTTPCGGGPDFAGCVVDGVELLIDSIALQNFDPPVGGIQTQYTARIRVRVNGQVIPEPTTALLLALGLGGLVARRRWGAGERPGRWSA